MGLLADREFIGADWFRWLKKERIHFTKPERIEKLLVLLTIAFCWAHKTGEWKHGETKKFYEGDSTLFLVNQREQTTAQVRLNSINAKVKLAEMIDMTRFFSSTESQKLG